MLSAPRVRTEHPTVEKVRRRTDRRLMRLRDVQHHPVHRHPGRTELRRLEGIAAFHHALGLLVIVGSVLLRIVLVPRALLPLALAVNDRAAPATVPVLRCIAPSGSQHGAFDDLELSDPKLEDARTVEGFDGALPVRQEREEQAKRLRLTGYSSIKYRNSCTS